jgi:hypothetical protein
MNRIWKRVLSIEYWVSRLLLNTHYSILILGAVLLVVLVPSTAAAQNTVALESLTVSLLPQYDDPRLMIVYEAELSGAGTSAIAIPNAVELTAAEAKAADGTYTAIEATFEGASDGRYITFTSPTPSVRLVFYQDSIPRQPERDMTFTLPGQRDDLSNLTWRVVFPLSAKEILTEPEMTSLGAVHFGMEGFEREAGALVARTPATQRLAWVRQSNAPSFAQPVSTPAPAAELPTELASLPAPLEKAARTLAGISPDLPTDTPSSGWLGSLRENPILWGGAAVFVLGLLLVLDGLTKGRRQGKL